LAAVVALVVTTPASAAYQGGTSLKPRAGEWWFTTWKILPKVWPLTQGAGVTVAVLDSGVQASVPDLRGAVLSGGDVTGNHTNGETDFNTVRDGHGTQMSVLIAGQGFGTGMVGVAPKAKILPVAVNASAVTLTSDPGRVAAGIMYAANHGARVIDIPSVYPSASTAGCDPATQAAVAYALARNIVVVAPAGSTNLIGARPSEPGSCFGVLAVGAIGPGRVLWADNVKEPYLTAVAAGANLISSGRDGRLVTGVSGARAASALVAGVAALIRSRYPSMPWYQVIQRIIGTALPEGGHVPNDSWGFGIVRMSQVVDATAFPVPASTANPVYARFLAWLATPQGRSVSRQIAGSASAAAAARHSGAAHSAAGKHGGRIPAIGTVVALVLILAAVAVLLTSVNRRPRRGRGVRDQLSAPGFRTPGGPMEPSPRTDPVSSILFAEDPLPPQARPYRVPPYSPVPDPRASSADPLVSDGDFYFPDSGTTRPL
jgi:subtilisin family serine protease